MDVLLSLPNMQYKTTTKTQTIQNKYIFILHKINILCIKQFHINKCTLLYKKAFLLLWRADPPSVEWMHHLVFYQLHFQIQYYVHPVHQYKK